MTIFEEEQPDHRAKVNPSTPRSTNGNILITAEKKKKTASIRKDTLNVLVNMEATDLIEHPGIDLVVVLDVSLSMEGQKINDLKSAMKFVIQKLGPHDRLCIIKFAKEAEMLCHLRLVNTEGVKMLNNIVDTKLDLAYCTNIEAGLDKGLRVVNGRRYNGRPASILLMSDGGENEGHALNVQNKGEPFDFGAFGFGSDHDAKLMAAIATTMKGGYDFVDSDLTKISKAFAAKLGGILTVVAENLKLKLTPGELSTIKDKDMDSGSYTKSPADKGGVTITYGNLYSREQRTVEVPLELGIAEISREYKVLYVSFEYRDPAHGIQMHLPSPLVVRIKRDTSALADPEGSLADKPTSRKAQTHQTRGLYAAKIEEAKTMAMAEDKKLEDARAKLREAQDVLDDVDAPYQDDPTLGMLRAELQQMLKLLDDLDAHKDSDDDTKKRYENNLYAYMLSSLMSHRSQRFASRGDTDTVQLYATPRMIKYMKQAEQFEAKPDMPVPSADDDAREELIANPVAAIAGPMAFYLRVAIQALQTLEEMITGNDVDY